MNMEVSSTGECVSTCAYNPIETFTLGKQDDDSDSDSYEACIDTLHYNIPIPYVFRIKAPSKKCEPKSVTCPPFNLQLDHTIAVIWHLFDRHKSDDWSLGITQLHWALYFLKGIKNPNKGTRMPDVEIAITAAEDALLECYANLANVVMRTPPPQGIPCIVCSLEKNLPKSSCEVCTSAGWGLLGRPRKSGQKEDRKVDPNFNFTFSKNVPTSLPPKHKQTPQQLRNEIEQLKVLAVKLTIPTDGIRKRVRLPSFAFPENKVPNRYYYY